MKKILFVAVLAVASVMAYAQPRAIGGRLGCFEGVSYQHALGESNMIEVELGLGVSGVNSWGDKDDYDGTRFHYNYSAPSLQAAFTYDWIDPFGKKFPWEHKGEWHWYMGVGAAAGYGWGYGWAHVHGNGYSASGSVGAAYNWGFVGAAGRVGVEYDFWFPLQLSVDYRPVLGLGMMDMNTKTQMAFHWQVYDICLGVRYKF